MIFCIHIIHMKSGVRKNKCKHEPTSQIKTLPFFFFYRIGKAISLDGLETVPSPLHH
jgi:hypothetical protein